MAKATRAALLELARGGFYHQAIVGPAKVVAGHHTLLRACEYGRELVRECDPPFATWRIAPTLQTEFRRDWPLEDTPAEHKGSRIKIAFDEQVFRVPKMSPVRLACGAVISFGWGSITVRIPPCQRDVFLAQWEMWVRQ